MKTPSLLAARSFAAISLIVGFCSATAQTPVATDSTATREDEVVQLEAMNVSADTAIGSYHAETSDMANKLPTSLKELSSSLEILNSSAIGDRNAITMQDLYPYVVGMAQVSPNGNGFTFRGFTNTGSFTQNIEFDGLQGSVSSKGAVSASNVESVEFLKGPNSVLYGQMHPGGLLNVVTKSPLENRQESVFVSVATYDTPYNNFGGQVSSSQSIDLTGPIDQAKHWLYRVVVAAQELKPFRPGDYERDFDMYPSLTYQLNHETYLTVKMEDVQEKRRADDGLIPLFNTVALAAPINTVYQEPTDTARDKGEAISVIGRAGINDHFYVRLQTRSVWHRDVTHELTQKGVKVVMVTPVQNSTIARQYNYLDNGHRYNYFDFNMVGHDLGWKNFNDTALFGVGGGDEFFDNSRKAFGPSVAATAFYDPVLGVAVYPANGTGQQHTIQTTDSLGEYLSDQLTIYERLHLSGGVRHDQTNQHGIDTINPTKTPYAHSFVTSTTFQTGVVFDIIKPLSIYGSYSESFVPNAVTAVDINGQAGFPPETGQQVETGLKFESADQKLFASVAVYRIDRTNVAVGTGQTIPAPSPFAGIAYFRLDGGQRGQGTEIEVEYHPLPYWQLQAGAAISRTTITSSALKPQSVGQDLANAPRNSGNFWSRYNVPTGFFRGLGAGVGVIYVSSSWGGDPSTAPTVGTNYYFAVPGWTRVDTSLYYKWHHYNVALNVQNVGDRQYYVSATNITQLLPGDLRKFTLSVRATF